MVSLYIPFLVPLITKSSNQDDSYDIQANGWVRNTKYYNLDEDIASYQYVERPYKLSNNQISEVTYASPGSIDYVGILTGGRNYKVGDALEFQEAGTDGFGVDIEYLKLVVKKYRRLVVRPQRQIMLRLFLVKDQEITYCMQQILMDIPNLNLFQLVE